MQRVKANFNGDIRRFQLPASPKFADLVALLSSLYSISDFTVRYKDDEGDLVTLASDSELAEAITTAPSGILRLDLLAASTSPSTAPQADSAAPTAPADTGAAPEEASRDHQAQASQEGNADADNDADREETPEEFMDGVAGFFESMFSPMCSRFQAQRRGGFGRGRGYCRSRGFGRGRRRGQQGRRAGQGPYRTQFFDFSETDFGRFMREFDPSPTCAAFRNVSAETRQALKTLMRELWENSIPHALMSAVPPMMHAMQTFLSSGIGESGPVPQEAIDNFVSALTPAITPHIGAPNAERVAVFARQALGDQGVIALLRQFSGVSARFSSAAEAAGAAASSAAAAAGRAMENAARFDVHDGIACDGCNCDPIIGTRYWCTTRPNFDLCDVCMANPDVDKMGMQFRAIEFPWLAEDSTRKVPRPTLTFGSRGVEVKMLQKILTDLGYMTPNMYRFKVGVYGPNTAKAVNRFREHYGLGMHGQYGMYDEIVAASLLSVLESNVPPSATAGTAAAASSSAGPTTGSDSTTTA